MVAGTAQWGEAPAPSVEEQLAHTRRTPDYSNLRGVPEIRNNNQRFENRAFNSVGEAENHFEDRLHEYWRDGRPLDGQFLPSLLGLLAADAIGDAAYDQRDQFQQMQRPDEGRDHRRDRHTKRF